MEHRNAITLRAYDEPFWVVVEPWASEFIIRIGEQCRVVACHPDALPTFGAELAGGKLILWVNEAGATFEFWRAGGLELSMPVPIPSLPRGEAHA
jgi:hypothetical protein